MVLFLDHVAIAVRDLNAAKHFFGLLGFEVADAVVIHGEQFSRLRGFEPLSSPVQDPPRPRAVRGAAAGARSRRPIGRARAARQAGRDRPAASLVP